MNPMDAMQLLPRLSTFKEQHPKFLKFLKAVGSKGLEEDSIMDVKFRSTDGQEYVANIKLTKEDIETIEIIKNLKH